MAKKSQYKQKLEYNNTYNKNNYRSFSVRFNNKSEKDIISWLEGKESIKGYLNDLVLADMEKTSRKAAKKVEPKKTDKKKVSKFAKTPVKKDEKKTAVKKKAVKKIAEKPVKKTVKKKK